MKPSTALAWKEWHESRIYLWIGLFIFLGLPAIAGLEETLFYDHRFTLVASRFIVILGGVLTVFIAVGATCRDLHGQLEDFWRSRPVSVSHWILTKYLVGLAVALASSMIPVAVESWIDTRREVHPALMLGMFPFHWIAVYSLAFVAGCLLRRPAHAAMIGLTAMLLLWFLPLVLPPIAWLNPGEFDPATFADLWVPRWKVFVAAMVGIAVVCRQIAVIAVRRDWHIQAGMRFLYSSIGGVFLLLLASAVFQLGTNLPVLQTVDIPNGGWVTSIYNINGHCSLYTRHADRFEQRFTIDVAPSGITLTESTPDNANDAWAAPDATTADGSEVRYFVTTDEKDLSHLMRVDMNIRTPNGNHIEERVPGVELWHAADVERFPRHYVWKDRLYVLSWINDPSNGTRRTDRLATFDISDPRNPKRLKLEPFDFRFDQVRTDPEKFVEMLPEIPGLPPRERMNLAMSLEGYWASWDQLDDVICSSGESGISEFRLKKLTDTVAQFDVVAHQGLSATDQLFGYRPYGSFYIKDGYLYQQRTSSGPARMSMFVYDLRGKKPLRLVGHFALADGTGAFCPLPDGRLLIGSRSKLLVVAAPKRTE